MILAKHSTQIGQLSTKWKMLRMKGQACGFSCQNVTSVFNLISVMCALLFQNAITFFENNVDPDQLASSEAS